MLGGLSGNVFHSTPVVLQEKSQVATQEQVKIRINEHILNEGLRISNKSSLVGFEINTRKKEMQKGSSS